MLRRTLILGMLVTVLASGTAAAGITLTPVGTFVAPTYITAPPGDTHRLFVVQQGGLIKLIKDGAAPRTFLDISSEVTNFDEQGLLSIAFAPDYTTSHRFFAYYTTKNCPHPPGCDEHVSEFTADTSGDTASASSEHVLLTIPHPGQTNHNGGQLQFGPDGDLYISVGDGGGENDTGGNAQHTDRLLGKILRILPGPASYSIPPGNPFNSGQALCSTGPHLGTNCPEIWAYGLRNPWRFSFDSATGDLVIADVGQDSSEEVDYARPGQNVGANYGWPCYEGLTLNQSRPAAECSPLPSPVVFPVLAYPHPQNCGSVPFCGEGIIGGYVMHDPALPSLDGCYVYGDLQTARLRITRLAQPSVVSDQDLGTSVSTLTSFGVDARGHIYAADYGDGYVYRLEDDGNRATDPSCAVPPIVTTGSATNVGVSTATMNGTIDPNASSTSYRFDYGTSSGYGSSTLAVDAGSGSSAVSVSASVSGLSASMTYHYRIVALRGGTTVAFGSDRTFTTKAAGQPGAKLPSPTLTSLTLSPTRFKAARSGPAVGTNRKVGTLVRFRLNVSATVSFSAERLRPGRKVGGRCVAPAHPNRHRAHCTLWSPVKGSFSLAGQPGADQLRFTGRLRGRTLAAGRYRLLARLPGGATPAQARFSVRG